MNKKVLLILVDGMRPDSLNKCNNPYVNELLEKSLYTLNCRTVYPSVTLPCHMSLFHSVDPSRHGITTNTFVPQVRPINGLFEQLGLKNKSRAMFYNWENLRNVRLSCNIELSAFYSLDFIGGEESNRLVSEATINALNKYNVDFCFNYFLNVDHMGHDYGWMSEEYLKAVSQSFDLIKSIIENIPEDYIVIITADHGGHDRSHGTEMVEDMTTPLIIYNKDIVPGIIDKPVSIKDITPTIAKLIGCDFAPEWEGTPII